MQGPDYSASGRRIKMLDVTYKLEAAKIHQESGITYIKTVGDDGFEWMVWDADIEDGYTYITGVNNGSKRMVKTVALQAVLKNA
jgi:hypothetical protein